MKRIDPVGTSRKIAAIPYYGGKFRMARYIVPIIESIPHKVYCEPFAGGASVFLWRDPGSSKVEVINDMNSDIYTMYKTFQLYPKSIIRSINSVPYSEKIHRLYRGDTTPLDIKLTSKKTMIERATSIYFRSSIGFGFQFNKSYKYDNTGNTNYPELWERRKRQLNSIIDRFSSVYIECKDAIDCIKQWDNPNTLFYIDPPYPGTYQGTYTWSNYDDEAFNKLGETLKCIRGSYILSSYSNSPILESSNMVSSVKVTRTNKHTKVCTEVIQMKVPDNVDLSGISKLSITNLRRDRNI